jgi:hypothetical protein
MAEVASELNNAAAHADGDGLRKIGCAELFQDVFNVDFYRFFGDEELVGDVAISITTGVCRSQLSGRCEGERYHPCGSQSKARRRDQPPRLRYWRTATEDRPR